MPVIVPNAGDTTGGNKYAALDQAEPDALDFEILSYVGSGVLTGCAVTSNNSSTTINVAAGVVVLGGIPYAIAANTSLGLPSAPADNRFDLVIVRVTAGIPALAIVQGNNSATNPAFPKSTSVITGSPSLTTNVNFATDVVLAALYRTGSTAVTGSRVVDKRKMSSSTILDQGAAAPNAGYGAGSGSLYYKTGAPNGTASGVWIKSSTGVWIELAQNVGAHLPIGAAFLWPCTTAAPAGCAEANGQGLATATYTALFAQLGYTHGGSGGTFLLPDYNNKFIRGTTSAGLVGQAVGADSTSLTTAHMPSHAHSLSAHTHTLAHTHGIAAGVTTSSEGTHTHTGITGGNGAFSVNAPTGYRFVIQSNGGGGAALQFIAGPNDITNSLVSGAANNHVHAFTTDPGTGHTHTTPALTTSSQSASTTSGPSLDTTGNAGTGATAVPTIPVSQYARWLIRISLGSDPSFTGGPPTGNPVETIQTITSRTVTFTLAMTDLHNMIQVGAAGSMSVHVPPASSVPFTPGSQIDFVTMGNNTITFVEDGVTVIRSQGGLKTITEQYTGASLKKLVAANEWMLIGLLA